MAMVVIVFPVLTHLHQHGSAFASRDIHFITFFRLSSACSLHGLPERAKPLDCLDHCFSCCVNVANNLARLQRPANDRLRNDPVLMATEALGVGFAFAATTLLVASPDA